MALSATVPSVGPWKILFRSDLPLLPQSVKLIMAVAVVVSPLPPAIDRQVDGHRIRIVCATCPGPRLASHGELTPSPVKRDAFYT